MTFGSDLELEGFARAFADGRVRPLLGLNVPDSAAKAISEDDSLLRNVYAEWKRQQPQIATESKPPMKAPAPTVAQTPPVSTGSYAPSYSHPAKDLHQRTTTELNRLVGPTGFWHVILAGLLYIASWVSMGIGFFLADHRQIPRGPLGLLGYGKESYLVAGDSLWWASAFALAALVLSMLAIVYGKEPRRPFSYYGGILGCVVAVALAIAIVSNVVGISTWV